MNSEKRKEYNHAYYTRNKEEIYEKNHVKVQCEYCKKEITSQMLSRHQKRTSCLKVRYGELIKVPKHLFDEYKLAYEKANAQ